MPASVMVAQEEPITYTVDQLAARLQCSRNHAYNWLAENPSACVRFGRRLFVSRRLVNEWVDACSGLSFEEWFKARWRQS